MSILCAKKCKKVRGKYCTCVPECVEGNFIVYIFN